MIQTNLNTYLILYLSTNYLGTPNLPLLWTLRYFYLCFNDRLILSFLSLAVLCVWNANLWRAATFFMSCISWQLGLIPSQNFITTFHFGPRKNAVNNQPGLGWENWQNEINEPQRSVLRSADPGLETWVSLLSPSSPQHVYRSPIPCLSWSSSQSPLSLGCSLLLRSGWTGWLTRWTVLVLVE